MILCSGTFAPGTPIRVKAEAAARAGFDAISVYAHEYEPGLRERLADLGLSVAELDGATAWMPGQPGTDVQRAVDIAADLHARSITVLETTGTAPDTAVAAEHFARVCERAALVDVAVDIEPYAWSGLASLASAAAVIRRAGCPNGGIMLDVWHLVRGPDAGHLDPACVDLVHGLQVSEAQEPRPGLSLRDECMTGRRLPGDRSASLVEALPHIPYGVEVFSLPGSPDLAAEQAYAAGRALRRPRPARDG